MVPSVSHTYTYCYTVRQVSIVHPKEKGHALLVYEMVAGINGAIYGEL